MNRRLTVLQVTSSARRRGAEVFAAQLGEQLCASGHHVTTLALEPQGDLPFERATRQRFDPRALAALTRRCRDHDVVVSHGGSTLAPVAAAATLARRPFVYRNIGDPSYWGRVRLADLRLGVPLRRAAHVVGLYDSAGNYLVRRYRVRPDRLTVISNAVDADRFPRRDDERRRAARATFNVGAAPVIGYLGSLSAEKRPKWAVDAASATGATLLVGGDGPMRADLERRCADHGVDGRFLGVVSDAEEFLAALDLLVIPSRTEGIPGVLIEAALVGVPVVATGVGGVGEVMGRLGAGLVVDAGDHGGLCDSAAAALADPSGYLADRATVVRHHDLKVVAERWAQVLSAAAATRIDRPFTTG